jgi:hypothetical protein
MAPVTSKSYEPNRTLVEESENVNPANPVGSVAETISQNAIRSVDIASRGELP